MDLSICIVNWNTGPLLLQCLQSILDNTRTIEYEIIIVDNASVDSSFSRLPEVADLDKRVKLIGLSDNIGFAAGNNVAFSHAQGRYLVTLNPDTVVTEDALDKAVAFLDTSPACGAMGPRLLNEDGSLQPSVGNFPTLWGVFWETTRLRKLFPRVRLFSSFKRTDLNYDLLQEVDQPSGACLFLRRSALDQVGHFDERFYMYYEEVDLCFRIKEHGWQIIYNPSLEIIHLGGASSEKNLDVRIVQNARSKLRYFAKRGDSRQRNGLSFAVLRVLMFFEFSVRSLGARTAQILGRDHRPGTQARLDKYQEVIRLCLNPAQLPDL